MRLTEAKKIVGNILQWQFLLMGVADEDNSSFDESIKLENYSLSELIQANSMVKKSNQRMLIKTTKKGTSITLNMTVNERLIAAVYCCIHFKPSNEIIAICNGKSIAIQKIRYEK
jgi:hypothetical protein